MKPAEELIADTPPPGKPSGLADIADLLNPPAEEPITGEQVIPEDEPPGEDAEELPTEQADPIAAVIDYDQVIPVKAGEEAEELTIGQLKDHYQDNRQFHQEREAWEDGRMRQDNEMIVARQEITNLVELLGDVKPEALAHLRKGQNARNAQQAELLLLDFPEWKDPATKARDRGPMLETIREYGYTEMEFGGIQDHRMIKALSDLTKLKARVKAAEAAKTAVPVGQRSTQRKPTPAQEERIAIKRAQTGTEPEKMAAIGALIDNG
jgi:hypothetical protein